METRVLLLHHLEGAHGIPFFHPKDIDPWAQLVKALLPDICAIPKLQTRRIKQNEISFRTTLLATDMVEAPLLGRIIVRQR